MATSIIPDQRPMFLTRSYSCGTGTIYSMYSSNSNKKIITKANLGISDISGYVMGGLKSFTTDSGLITILTARPNVSSGDVLYLLNFSEYDISTTARVTVIWVRSDKAKQG